MRTTGSSTLIIGTGNRGKARELLDLLEPLGLDVLTLADVTDPLDVAESADSFAENAAVKASQQAAHLCCWVLADDSGLEVDALAGAPGVHTARYAGPRATAAENRQKLLAALAGVPGANRGAQFRCHIALADPQGTIRATSSGRCRGRIRTTEAGAGGFGYDPLFEVLEYHRTLAELGAAAKNCLSHRGRAIERLLSDLVRLLSQS